MTVDPYDREHVAVNPFSTHEGYRSHEDSKVIFDPFRSHPDSVSSVDKRCQTLKHKSTEKLALFISDG